MLGVSDPSAVPLDKIDVGRMLEFWRWLIPESHRPLFATPLGDLFFASPTGEVSWLHMGVGEPEVVAVGEQEFRTALANEDNRNLWFAVRLVDALRAAGKVLGPGEVYSYRQLPLLG